MLSVFDEGVVNIVNIEFDGHEQSNHSQTAELTLPPTTESTTLCKKATGEACRQRHHLLSRVPGSRPYLPDHAAHAVNNDPWHRQARHVTACGRHLRSISMRRPSYINSIKGPCERQSTQPRKTKSPGRIRAFVIET